MPAPVRVGHGSTGTETNQTLQRTPRWWCLPRRNDQSTVLLARNDQRHVGPIVLRHQPNAVDPFAVFQDELAALVFVDRPGNAVGKQPVADGARGDGVVIPAVRSAGCSPLRLTNRTAPCWVRRRWHPRRVAPRTPSGCPRSVPAG